MFGTLKDWRRISTRYDRFPNRLPLCNCSRPSRYLLVMSPEPKFALNVAFFVRHDYFLHPKSGNLQEVSRESVHIYTLE